MIVIDTRSTEACSTASWPGWDTVLDPATGAADWTLAGAASGNAGGLRATAPLATAVILCLFTDRRCPASHPLAKLVEAGDPRGWWGDAVDVRADLGEDEMGSLLWLLERASMLPEIERWAEAMIRDAMAPLLQAKVAIRLEVDVERRSDDHGLNWALRLYDRDGSLIHDGKYDFAWSSVSS
ncbi:hypothetical protein EYW49_20535 [Siculibacillus lacustris]|uniref:Mu-like prophage protein gp46 n=1 Tax=Siculibacillus lacustris TaxID=1549641 RepID=A0A4Q9VEU0_9HYPH|nr:phage GP46 family protein [Siculibacillus lacustris]TBW33349.1 hypothetical protein EYW49_20535 [Siculibacillus lacustris]